MKTYNEFLNEEEQLLKEAVDKFQFAFGFELEAYVKHDCELDKMLFEGLKKLFNDGKIHINPISKKTAYERLKEFFMKDILSGGFSEGELGKKKRPNYETGEFDRVMEKVTDDPSLKHDWEHLAFEFNSPVFPYSKAWINHVINCLQKWFGEDGIFTDARCGFHNHISYEGMTDMDRKWIYAQFASHYKETIRKFGSMSENGYGIFLRILKLKKKYDFSGNAYASTEDLKKLSESLKVGNYANIKSHLETDKFSFFNLHRSGTIEWRGPRNFANAPIRTKPVDVPLDDKKTIEDAPDENDIITTTQNLPQYLKNIRQFYAMMISLILTMSQYQDEQYIMVGGNKVDKNTFFESMSDEKLVNNVLKLLRAYSTMNITEAVPIIKGSESYEDTEDSFTLAGYAFNAPSELIFVNKDGNKEINFKHCSFKAKKLKLKEVRIDHLFLTKMAHNNVKADNCIFGYTTIISTELLDYKITECVLESTSEVLINTSNYHATMLRNIIRGKVKFTINDMKKEELDVIRDFCSKNDIVGSIYISDGKTQPPIKFQSNEINDTWITNDEKYKKLLENKTIKLSMLKDENIS